MSWASRRRTAYLSTIFAIFAVLIGVPLAIWLYEPATCFDGKLNQGESAVDKGGPCKLLDERSLIPHAVLWTRAFSVRDGSHSAVAYIENPNANAGVALVPYRFRLYDAENILVAERDGSTFVMPGSITPVYEGRFDTGNREVARAFFEFRAPLVWERLQDRSVHVEVSNKQTTNVETFPRVTAIAENTSVMDLNDVRFVAVIFDGAGNAFASSHTVVPLLAAGSEETISFTWPDPFPYRVARVDVLPIIAPTD